MPAMGSGVFNGTTSKIDFGNNIGMAGSDGFAITAWVKTTSATPSTSMTIISKVDSATGTGWWLKIRGDVANDPYEIGVKASDGTGFIAQFPRPSDTNWQHVGWASSGALLAIFTFTPVNGYGQSRTIILNNLAGGDITNTKHVVIGAIDGGTEFFDGSIASVTVNWKNGATTPSLINNGQRQILQLMHRAQRDNEAFVPFALYAPLDTNGNMGRDLKGGLTGTVTDVTYQTDVPDPLFQTMPCMTFNSANLTRLSAAGPFTTSNNNLAAFTVIAWVRPTGMGTGTGGRITSKAQAVTGGFHCRLAGTNALALTVQYATTVMTLQTSDNIWTTNAWNKFAWTFGSITATNNHIYCNDVEPTYATTTNGVGARSSDTSLAQVIGSLEIGVGQFDGDMFCFQMYNAQLTAAQCQQARPFAPASYNVNDGGSLMNWEFFNSFGFFDLSGNNAVYLQSVTTTQKPTVGTSSPIYV